MVNISGIILYICNMEDRINEIKKQLEEKRENRISDIIEWFEELKSFDGDIDNIPEVPVVPPEIYQQYVIPNLIRCGAIPIEKLVVGHIYYGTCRNARAAVWKENKKFEYVRTKFGSTYKEEINHFEEDDGYDVFVPIKDLNDMTYDDFMADLSELVVTYPEDWRMGQKIFNAVDELYGVARYVQFNEGIDCFYNDDAIPAFIETTWEVINGEANDDKRVED